MTSNELYFFFFVSPHYSPFFCFLFSISLFPFYLDFFPQNPAALTSPREFVRNSKSLVSPQILNSAVKIPHIIHKIPSQILFINSNLFSIILFFSLLTSIFLEYLHHILYVMCFCPLFITF